MNATILTRAPVLQAFDAALAEFEAAHTAMREELDRSRAFTISGPATETACDVVAFSSLLRDTYIATGDAIDDETAAMAQEWAAGRFARASEIHAAAWPSRDIRRLLAAYKAWFYFGRIYQDMLFRAIGRTVVEPAGYGMKNALNRTNPVRRALDVDATEYMDWFKTFQQLRNTLKNGVSAHTRGAEGPDLPIDYGLGLTDPKDDKLYVIRLRDVSLALIRSAELARVAALRLNAQPRD
jgi:hypothetical protein